MLADTAVAACAPVAPSTPVQSRNFSPSASYSTKLVMLLGVLGVTVRTALPRTS